MEICRRRIIVQTRGKCIWELTRRVFLSQKDIRHGKAALHASLPCKKYRRDLIFFREPCGIYHASHIENCDHFFKFFTYCTDHFLLSVCQAVIGLFKNPPAHLTLGCLIWILPFIGYASAVPSFPGKTADHDHRRVCKFSCLPYKCLRKLRFYGHTGNRPVAVLPLYLIFIKSCQRFKYHINCIIFYKSVVKVPHMGNCHISASAAALYIVKYAFPEQSHFSILFQWQKPFVIFKQHHAFASCFSCQCQMLRRCCHFPIVPL